jgi:multisubunit Na+/H+ antiporter MnhF subunit
MGRPIGVFGLCAEHDVQHTWEINMILETVLMFGCLLALFEFVVLSMVPPRMRLRVLGNSALSNALHLSMMMLNLWVHWGTVVGTMSATLSFVASIITVKAARLVYGSFDGRYYRVGLIRYLTSEIV